MSNTLEKVTAYSKIKDSLRGNQKVDLIGEIHYFSENYQTPEAFYLYVAPVKPIPFEVKEMRGLIDLFRVPEVTTMKIGPGWRQLMLEDGTTMQSLMFGALAGYDDLRGSSDLLDPFGYIDYLQRIRKAPCINETYSKRAIWLHTYPNVSYAQQIFNYQSNRAAGHIEEDPTFEFLSHDITEVQLLALFKNPHLLSALPKVPDLQQFFSGR